MPRSRPRVRRTAPGPATAAIVASVGSTGLAQTDGYVYEEYLPELSGEKGRLVYREMESDPIVGSAFLAIEHLIRKVSWWWGMPEEPADPAAPPGGAGAADPDPGPDPDLETAVRFLNECWDDMSVPFGDVVPEILSMLPYGWAYLETLYKVRGGASDDPTRRSAHDDNWIGWRKFEIRSQHTLDRWEFGPDGGLRGMRQYAAGGSVLVPIEKALLFRTTNRRGNPEGRSVLRSAYRPWYYKRNIETIEAIGIERDLAGIPVMDVPSEYMAPDAPPGHKALFEMAKAVVTTVKRDDQEGLVIPSDTDEKGKRLFDFRLITSGGSRQIDTGATITRYDQRIAMTMLADFLLLGHEKAGSFALSVDKTGLFSLALVAWLDAIAEVFTWHAAPRLLRLNGLEPRRKPVLRHGPIEEIDLDRLATYLQKISLAGFAAVGGKSQARITQALLGRVGLPLPDDDDVRDPPEEAEQGINPAGQTGTGGARQRGKRKPAPDQSGTSGGPGTTNRITK